MIKTFLSAGGRVLVAGALVALVSSCSSKGPRLYSVTGMVRINGEPARDVNIMFTPVTPLEGVTEPLSPSAVTGDDGTYHLMSFKPGDGAPAGDYQVTVSYPMSRFNKHLNGVDRLKGKFANPKTSGLTAKVEPKSNELAPFDLKADVLPEQTNVDPVKMRKKAREG